jgi:NAD(P)-dependent dehydrogenase (short-subunit alcohol dehydrogenase family)
MSSAGGFVPVPFAATYAASKAGLRAFAASLRQELAGAPNIHVATVFPTFVDTPGLAEHGANMAGVELSAGRTALAPEYVAQRICALIEEPRPETTIGFGATAVRIGYGLAPIGVERLAGALFRRYLRTARRVPRTEGAVAQPVARGTSTRGPKPPASGLARPGLAVGAAVLAYGVLRLARR